MQGCKGARVHWCKGDGNVVEDSGCVVVVSAVHVCVPRDLGIVSSAAAVLGMSVVCGVRGVVECVKCACVWLEAAWEEMKVSGFTKPVETAEVLDVCLCLGYCVMWLV